MKNLVDDSPMPFGKYKGTKMANVPATYLKWLYTKGYAYQGVKEYVEENLDAIDLEIKNGK